MSRLMLTENSAFRFGMDVALHLCGRTRTPEMASLLEQMLQDIADGELVVVQPPKRASSGPQDGAPDHAMPEPTASRKYWEPEYADSAVQHEIEVQQRLANDLLEARRFRAELSSSVD